MDLDGTIREPLSGKRYFQDFQDQQIIPGAEVAIGAYKDNWIIAGITNQGGVAAGYKTIIECVREQQYTLELFPELREIYFCPDFEGKKCFRVARHNVYNHSKTKWSGYYRKPKAGMLHLAMLRHKHTPENTIYVGDRPEDEAAGRSAGVKFQWGTDWIEQHQAAIIS